MTRDHPVEATPPRGNRFTTTWNAELVRDRILAWAALYGAPPTSADWNPARAAMHVESAAAKARAWVERAARRNQGGPWPDVDTVRRYFGSFTAALEAAGFEPRPAHRPPRALTDRHREQLRTRYGGRAGANQLAQSMRAVMAARAADDGLALKAALLDLAAAALAWGESITDHEQTA